MKFDDPNTRDERFKISMFYWSSNPSLWFDDIIKEKPVTDEYYPVLTAETYIV